MCPGKQPASNPDTSEKTAEEGVKGTEASDVGTNPQSAKGSGANRDGDDGIGPRGKRCLICLAVLVVLFISGCLALIFLSCLPPNLPFPEYNATLPRPLTGRQLPKDWLSGATPIETVQDSKEALKLRGPESLARRGESLYTGILGGNLVKLSPKDGKFEVKNVTKFGEQCEDIAEGLKCGRPMGMRFHSDGFLYVTDAYLGLYRVNIETGEKIRLAKSHDFISGHRSKLTNDLDIAKDGTIYWSDASTNVNFEDVILEFMSEPSGRLLVYDPVEKKSHALIRKVQCASGVQLSPDEDFVLVAEGGKDRILRYHLKGPKSGTSDIFVDGLPGVPDKIRKSGRPEGGYLVWLIVSHGSAAKGGGGGILPWLRQHRTIRTMLMRGLYLIEKIFKNIHERFEDSFSRSVIYSLGNMGSMGPFMHSEGLVLELDAHGNITGSFYSADQSVQMASEMHVLPGGRGGVKGLGSVYIASPINPHVLQVPIKEGPMLEMAMAYSKANTALDIVNVTSEYVDASGLEGSNNNVSVEDKLEKEATKESVGIEEINSNLSPNDESALPEKAVTAMDDPDVEISVVKNVSSTTALPRLAKILEEDIDIENSKDDDTLSQFTTESLIDSFFATATEMESSTLSTPLDISEILSLLNETESSLSSSRSDRNTSQPKKKLGEDASGNLVLEDPVLRFLLDSKKKTKELNELGESGNYDQNSTKSLDVTDDGEDNGRVENIRNEKNFIALDSMIDITTATTSVAPTEETEVEII